MSRYSKYIAGGALSLAVSGGLQAQASVFTASQTVTFQVDAVTQITVAAVSASLVINTAVAGSNLTQATASSSYSLTTNNVSSKITAEIDAIMPSGVTLKTNLTAPGTGSSAGALALSTTAVDVVTGITPVVGSAVAIAYTLDATVVAGIVASDTRLVTYTVVVAP